MAQTFGVVHLLISSETAEHRLRSNATSAWRPFLPVRTSASVSPANSGQPERVVEYAVTQQSREIAPSAAVEIESAG
jgi:hypothetical protein